MAIKTRDKILEAARLLFNQEGESNVAMIDIAAALDISPGNLYYHFKGKDQLIPIMYEAYEAEFSKLLTADIRPLTSLQDRWAYCFLLLDVMYQYRCLLRLDIIRFDKALSRRNKRLQSSLTKVMIELILMLQQANVADSTDSDCSRNQDNALLADTVVLLMLSWISHSALDSEGFEEKKFLHKGVYRIFFQIAATLQQREEFIKDCKQLMLESLTEGITVRG